MKSLVLLAFLFVSPAKASDVHLTCSEARTFAAERGYLELHSVSGHGFKYYFFSDQVYDCSHSTKVVVSTIDSKTCVVGCTANSDGPTGGGGNGGG